MTSDDPSTETWREAFAVSGKPVHASEMNPSTSEQLRQTQAALAASQQDLTRVEVQNEHLRGDFTRTRRERDEARHELAAERDKRANDISAYNNACNLLAAAEQERDELRAELARLRAEKETP